MQKQRSPQRSSDSPTKIPKEEISHEVVEFHSLDESIFNTKQDKSGLIFFICLNTFDLTFPHHLIQILCLNSHLSAQPSFHEFTFNLALHYQKEIFF